MAMVIESVRSSFIIHHHSASDNFSTPESTPAASPDSIPTVFIPPPPPSYIDHPEQSDKEEDEFDGMLYALYI
jgi:hypothetical protein